jgi:type IV pilus assembly protein PilE
MRRYAGFTLIEVMIAVVVVGILASIAYPAYTDYVRRGKIAEATSELGVWRAKMEQYFLDNRTYVDGGGNCGVAAPSGAAVKYFTFTCPGPTATAYTLQAAGVAAQGMSGFTYTINQQNAKSSTITGVTGWTGNANCWVTKKGGVC